MQGLQSDSSQYSQQEEQNCNPSLDDQDEEKQLTLSEISQRLETIKIFKGSWIYAEMMRMLNDQYQDLFNKAIQDSNRDMRSDRIEQMKGVAYATGLLDIIEQNLKHQIGEDDE